MLSYLAFWQTGNPGMLQTLKSGGHSGVWAGRAPLIGQEEEETPGAGRLAQDASHGSDGTNEGQPCLAVGPCPASPLSQSEAAAAYLTRFLKVK